MLKTEQNHLFIWGATCVFGTITLLSVFLYSTDKLVLDVSTITRSGYTSEQKVYPPSDDKAQFKIVRDNISIQHSIQKPTVQKRIPSLKDKDHFKIVHGNTTVQHSMKNAPILSSEILKKSNSFSSNVMKAAAFIPKVVAVNPLLAVGKLSNAFLFKLAVHSVKIISANRS